MLVPQKWMAILAQSAFKRDDDRSIMCYLDIFDSDEFGTKYTFHQMDSLDAIHGRPSQVFANA